MVKRLSFIGEITQNKEKYDKTFLYYKNHIGDIQLIAFQDGVFFTLRNGEPYMINPMIVERQLEALDNKELTLVGRGKYGQRIGVFANRYQPLKNQNIKVELF